VQTEKLLHKTFDFGKRVANFTVHCGMNVVVVIVDKPVRRHRRRQWQKQKWFRQCFIYLSKILTPLILRSNF